MNLFPSINLVQEVEDICVFIKNTVQKSGSSDVTVAVSGGVDSATALLLSIRALGKAHVRVLLLPYGELNPVGTKNAGLVIQTGRTASSHIEEINIKPMVDAYDRDGQMDEIRRGNIMARVRMTILFDRAKKYRTLVVGTENKSEFLLGYFTRFGDEASDIEPIRHLYKTQVFELARFLGVPERILDAAPTAGLWGGQTDESEFGFTYTIADQILYCLYELHDSEKALLQRGFSKEEIKKVKVWVHKNHFKHEVPYVYQPTKAE